MVAIKAPDVDRFIARPDPARPVALVYGPDAGLVRERTDALIKASVDDPRDPFALARLDGDDLSAEPTRLIDEVNTVPLFGGRRAVWVKAGGRNFTPAVEALVENAPPDCRVIIEAGALRRNAPLRAICERAKNAVALPCYEDNDQGLNRLIDSELRAANLTIAPEARSALLPLLGADRLSSRSEIGKLALYARGKDRVELDDVVAVVTDASVLALDTLVDAAFGGRTGDLEFQFGKALTAGTSPGSIMFAVQRHVASLHKARLAVDDGRSAEAAVGSMVPPVFGPRQTRVVQALQSWTAARLQRAMAQLADAAFDVRRQSDLADTIAQRALLSIAVNARRRE